MPQTTSKPKTIVYVDGFNLYYRALKGSNYKWLDFMKVSEKLLRGYDIVGIRYYSANVSLNISPTAPRDQHIYLSALKIIPNLEVILGKFQVTEKFMYLKQPLLFKPDPKQVDIIPMPHVVKVIKTEKKGSDVNLGVQLVRDAFLERFDHAAVITNDTDLVEAIRIVTQEVGLPVTLICPEQKHRPAQSLKEVATETIRLREKVLKVSQFDDVFTVDGKTISKPSGW